MPVTSTQLCERALALGISEFGVCAAAPYEGTERDMADRGERGLFADLKFTMSRPEHSCHPERAVEDAQSVVSTALCYWHPEPEEERLAAPGAPIGRVARYTRADAYDALRERLGVLADELEQAGHRARVLVDDNHHVDREAAARSGVGFYGKHTNLITRRYGSWVVLGTIVTSALLEPTPEIRPGCGSCTACIDACPTGAIVEAGVLDVGSCISYWAQSRHSIPEPVREAMEDRVYGCDICQDVCPWNRGVEARRSHAEPASGQVDLREWLQLPDRELNERYERFFVPRRQVKFLRRNALVALGNSQNPANAALVAPFLQHEDKLLREHAAWALRRLGGPIADAALSDGIA